jgi:hypothetical protein
MGFHIECKHPGSEKNPGIVQMHVSVPVSGFVDGCGLKGTLQEILRRKGFSKIPFFNIYFREGTRVSYGVWGGPSIFSPSDPFRSYSTGRYLDIDLREEKPNLETDALKEIIKRALKVSMRDRERHGENVELIMVLGLR